VTSLDFEGVVGETSPGAASAAEGTRRQRITVAMALAVAWLLLVALLVIFANLLPFVHDPYAIDPLNSRMGPSASHWFGTDSLGRDIFTRCVYGARTSFLVTSSALGIALVVGGTLGMSVGYFRGILETVVMTVTDIVLAFPGIVLLLGILTFMGQSVRNVALALALLATPGIIRVTRANTLIYSERLFVTAARTLGASDRRIIAREIFPNIAPPIAAISLIILGILVIAEGGLSFLGLGVPLPRPTWGGMIASGIPDLQTKPLITLFPALTLFLTVLAFNVLGDELRARFETKQSKA
jgi:peptide/nickel transport system permease protein